MKLHSSINAVAAGKVSPPKAGVGDRGDRAAFAAMMDESAAGDADPSGVGGPAASPQVPGVAPFKAVAATFPSSGTAASVRVSADGPVAEPDVTPNLADGGDAPGLAASAAPPAWPETIVDDACTSAAPRSDEPAHASERAPSSPASDLMAFLIGSMGAAPTSASLAHDAAAGRSSGSARSSQVAEAADRAKEIADVPVSPLPPVVAEPKSVDAPPSTVVVIANMSVETHQGFSRGQSTRPVTKDSAAARVEATDETSEAASGTPPVPVPDVDGGDDPAGRHPVATSADASKSPPPHEPAPDAPSPNNVQQVLPWKETPPGGPTVARAADATSTLASQAAVPEIDASPHVAPARSMVLQLAPDGLGTLSVRLHVVGSALDVRLDASDADTASLLDSERDALATALSDEGYRLHTLSIGTLDARPQGSSHGAPTAGPGHAHDPDGGGGNGGGSGIHRRREREQKERRQTLVPGSLDGVALVHRDPALFV